MSLSTLGEVRTQISFPLFESRSCENFGLLIAHFSIFLSEKKKMIKHSPHFDQLLIVSFLITQLKNQLLIVRNSRNCDSREAEN